MAMKDYKTNNNYWIAEERRMKIAHWKTGKIFCERTNIHAYTTIVDKLFALFKKSFNLLYRGNSLDHWIAFMELHFIAAVIGFISQ